MILLLLTVSLKNIDDVESVTSGYDTSLYYSPSSKDLSNGLGDDRMSVNALSEDMIKSFTPQMSSGKWLSNASANGDLIPAVVTENSNYKTGDIVTIMHKEKVGEMSLMMRILTMLILISMSMLRTRWKLSVS